MHRKTDTMMIDTDNENLLHDIKILYRLHYRDLKLVFTSLGQYENENNMNIKKVGIYKHVKKLIPCFEIILEIANYNSIQSLITLERMIADNYAILFLLTSFSTKEEQKLRYYLYLMDGAKTRSNCLKKFSSVEMPIESVNKENEALEADARALKALEETIKLQELDSIVSEIIINESNWKYKAPKSLKKKRQNSHSWIELYKIAKIPEHHAEILQKYHSSFVHGLGVSLFIGEEDDSSPLVISTLQFCSILQTLIIKILTIEFEDETRNVKINKVTERFMEQNWHEWS